VSLRVAVVRAVTGARPDQLPQAPASRFYRPAEVW